MNSNKFTKVLTILAANYIVGRCFFLCQMFLSSGDEAIETTAELQNSIVISPFVWVTVIVLCELLLLLR